METDTFGDIVVRTINASHIDHFTPQHVILQYLEGFFAQNVQISGRKIYI